MAKTATDPAGVCLAAVVVLHPDLKQLVLVTGGWSVKAKCGWKYILMGPKENRAVAYALLHALAKRLLPHFSSYCRRTSRYAGEMEWSVLES